MRLLETTDGRTYSLTKEFHRNDQIPPYAILSHTWDADQEVTFEDLNEDNKSRYSKLRASLRLRMHSSKKGYQKLRFCASQAKRDGLRYFWVDTCCIDKKNTPELQTAINSMFCWYRDAAKCYVFLADVSTADQNRNMEPPSWELSFLKSRWFTRGWTLQELLAPAVVEFFSREGVCLGNRMELKKLIHEITDIPLTALSGVSLDKFSVDEKLSWAAERETTREEDEVYSLLGIFNITLPFIYDEGYDRALRRLLEKIHAVPDERSHPGQRMSRSTVPFGRDSEFVTRDSLRTVLRLCAKPGSHAALVGLGGVGKSQIAIEYAYQMLDKIPGMWVFWVHAETQAKFRESYYEIAKKTKLDGWNDSKADILQLVSTWLRNEANGRWLMVLDSADDASVLFHDTPASCATDMSNQTNTEPLLSSFLPRTSTGSVLVTSRSREVACMLTGAWSNIVEVRPMDDQDAYTLLRRKLTASVQRDEAYQLISALDHMPLALTQAAAFINRTPRMSVTRYLKELDSNRAHLLDKDIVDIRRGDHVSNSIMTTWQISFEYIRKRSRMAARLLSLMCLFDRQGIPASLLLSRYVRHEHGDTNFEDDMYMLTSLCLVKEVDGMNFEMHGLVQYSMKRWLELQNELEHWKEIYVALIDESYPVGEREHWSVCQTLLPHALAALNNLPVDADALEAWASLSLNVGWYVGNMGEYNKAHKLVSDSFEVREILLGPEDPETLDSLNSLGLTLKRLGRYEEAKAVLRKALEAQERTLGAGHSATLTTGVNLASIHNDQTQWIEAEKLLMGVLQKSGETGMGQDHPLVLDSLTMLATVYRDQDRWTDAAKLNLQLLEAREVQLGADAPLTLTAKGNLAFTYRKQGRLREAEEMQLQIIEQCKTGQGAQMELLGYEAHLAQTYRAQGRLDEAEHLEVRILETSKEKLGLDHFDTIRRMGHLASTYWKAGKLEQAQALDVQVLELRRITLGEDHSLTLDSKSNLATTYGTQGLYDKAEALQLEVLKVQTEKLGENHPVTLAAKISLASTYLEKGRLSEAEQMSEEVLKARMEVLGPDHPDTLSSMRYLAITYKVQGREKEAVKLMGKCCKAYEKVLPPESVDLFGFKETFKRWSEQQKRTCKED